MITYSTGPNRHTHQTHTALKHCHTILVCDMGCALERACPTAIIFTETNMNIFHRFQSYKTTILVVLLFCITLGTRDHGTMELQYYISTL